MRKPLSFITLLLCLVFHSSDANVHKVTMAPDAADPITHQILSAPSVLFLIDNSGSMTGSDVTPAEDRWGERFKLASDLIDSLYMIFDSVEVGVSVFKKYLYYDPSDDSRFAQCPEQDTGAYLPLIKLDSSYAPDGKMGFEIVWEYLRYDTVGANYKYVDLRYIPSNVNINGASSNITAGFQAAKNAFKTARYPKHRQFIIFFTDGVATYPGEVGSPEANQYIEDAKTGVPTTFTVYFTQDSVPPPDLVEMTDNIKYNDFSFINDSSAMWPITLGQQTIKDLILDHILTTAIVSKNPPEDSLTIPVDSTVHFSLTPNPLFFILDEAIYEWTKNDLPAGTGDSYQLYTDSSMEGKTYKITCIVSDTNLADTSSWIVAVVNNTGTQEDNSIISGDIAIRQYYQKSITIAIPHHQDVIPDSHLRIYSLCGRKVLHLDLCNLRTGINRINIEPFNSTGSLYIAELQVGKKRLKTKILLTQ